ncbi:LysE family translocator [Marinoscillum sp. 108]|jgi:threonine/homoserine/homoserine lactone efflux protein|uniref:LysE family translocator n=1 Tax=Marinoscillum luteum TaxID=861051 RepID=A0ABW7N5M0_9BACT|nr:LysE family transporter [Marinoscillum sp. 108]VXD13006.1 Threonine/homoserine/homoserine lactone efflux protein [Marinoscillum sp. 108]
MPSYFTGLLFGLIFIFSFGPGFFALLQTSVQKGFKKAIFLALGISLSDVLYVALAIMGLASLLEKPTARMWMAIVGTVVLIAYGLYSWFKKPKIYQEKQEADTELSYLKYMLKGFVLNGFNPFIVIFWLGIIGLVAVNYDYSSGEQIYFFVGVLTTILVSDITKAFIAYRLRAMVTPKKILILNRSVGVILILFGIQMIYFLFNNFLID